MTIEAYAPTNSIESERPARTITEIELGSRAVPPVLEWGPQKHTSSNQEFDESIEDIQFTD